MPQLLGNLDKVDVTKEEQDVTTDISIRRVQKDNFKWKETSMDGGAYSIKAKFQRFQVTVEDKKKIWSGKQAIQQV